MTINNSLASALMLLILGAFSIPNIAAQPQQIMVGTYAYPSIDREAAVKPLATLIEKKFGLPTKVLIADSPTELATMVAQNTVQIAVPNLVGYALIAAANSDIHVLAVPDNIGSTYTSSIVIHTENNKPVPLTETIELTEKPIGMVWPDSTSGAIVATSYLKTIIDKQQQQILEQITYLQSHQNVLIALEQNKINIGVLATKVYNERSQSQDAPLHEVWRSPPIPYGPVVCNNEIEVLCEGVREVLLSNDTDSQSVLNGLKLGWVEFESSTSFVVPEADAYAPFIDHFAKKN